MLCRCSENSWRRQLHKVRSNADLEGSAKNKNSSGTKDPLTLPEENGTRATRGESKGLGYVGETLTEEDRSKLEKKVGDAQRRGGGDIEGQEMLESRSAPEVARDDRSLSENHLERIWNEVVTTLSPKNKTRTSYFGKVATNCFPPNPLSFQSSSVIVAPESLLRAASALRPLRESVYCRMRETDASKSGDVRGVAQEHARNNISIGIVRCFMALYCN